MSQTNSLPSHENSNRSQNETSIKDNKEKSVLEQNHQDLQNQDNNEDLNQSRDNSELIAHQQSDIEEDSGKITKLQFLDELRKQIGSQIYNQNKKKLTLFLASLQLRALQENREYSKGVKSVFEGDQWSHLKRLYNKKHQQTKSQLNIPVKRPNQNQEQKDQDSQSPQYLSNKEINVDREDFDSKKWISDLEEEQKQLRGNQNRQKNSLLSCFHYC